MGVEFDFFVTFYECVFVIISFESYKILWKYANLGCENFNLLRVNCCDEKFICVKATPRNRNWKT